MSLKQKIDMYQRNNMVNGLMMPGTGKHQETKQLLDNIGTYEKGMTAADMYH